LSHGQVEAAVLAREGDDEVAAGVILGDEPPRLGIDGLLLEIGDRDFQLVAEDSVESILIDQA
jgi:hypothetical protein